MKNSTPPTARELATGNYISFTRSHLVILGFSKDMMRFLKPNADGGKRYTRALVISFLGNACAGKLQLRQASVLKAHGILAMMQAAK